MANTGIRSEAIPRKVIIDAITPVVKKIMRDAIRKGGKLGAEHVTDVING
jgi:hypothetical protein